MTDFRNSSYLIGFSSFNNGRFLDCSSFEQKGKELSAALAKLGSGSIPLKAKSENQQNQKVWESKDRTEQEMCPSLIFVFNFLETVNDIPALSENQIEFTRMFFFDSKEETNLKSCDYQKIRSYFEEMTPEVYNINKASLFLKVRMTRFYHIVRFVSINQRRISFSSILQVVFWFNIIKVDDLEFISWFNNRF